MAIFTDNWQRNGFFTSKDIVKDDVVKVKNPLGEAFWVIVTRVFSNGIITGSVNNNLVYATEYNFGDTIMFTKKDIREHKDLTIRQNQHQIISDIMSDICQKLGRMPTIEEFELIFTRFHN